MHSFFKKYVCICGLCFFLTVLACLPATQFRFLNFDDIGFVVCNPVLAESPMGSFFWGLSNTVLSNWIPLTLSSWSMDFVLGGLNPSIFHTTNVLLHGVNAMLVGILFFLLLTRGNQGNGADLNTQKNHIFLMAAFFGALFWALHPLRVESVAWVSARKDVLFLFFYLLSLVFYLCGYPRMLGQNQLCRGTNRFSISIMVSFACFILSCLAKGMAVSLPCVLILLDWCLQKKSFFSATISKWPWLLCSAFFSIVQILTRPDTLPTGSELSWGTRLLNSFAGYGFYIEKTLLPLDLVPVYFYESHQQGMIPYVCVSALATVLLIGLLLWKGNCFVKAGVLFYLVTALPIIGIVQTWIQEAADRFSYLPTLPLYLGGSYGVAQWLLNQHGRWKTTLCTLAMLATFALMCWGFSCQLMVWQDTYSLWDRQLAIRPAPVIYETVARHAIFKGDTKRALRYLAEGLARDPDNPRLRDLFQTAKTLLSDPGPHNRQLIRAALPCDNIQDL